MPHGKPELIKGQLYSNHITSQQTPVKQRSPFDDNEVFGINGMIVLPCSVVLGGLMPVSVVCNLTSEQNMQPITFTCQHRLQQ